MSSKIKNSNNEIPGSPPIAIKNSVAKTSSNGGGSGPSTPRSNKTLGWFLNEALVEKEAAILAAQGQAPASDTTSNASGEEKKKSRRGGGKQRKKITVECVLPRKNPNCIGADSYNVVSPSEDKLSASGKEQSKEDYWYYDPVSDGFYYEQNGSRGWRKRMPANASLSRPKPFDALEKLQHQQQQQQQQQVQQQQQQQQQQNVGISPQYFTPAISKYYDPNTDGYFYEMASVDGWKRRDVKRASSSQSSISSSSAPIERDGSIPLYSHQNFDELEEKTAAPCLQNLPPYLKNTYKNPMEMIVCQNSVEKPNSVASSSSFSDEPSYGWPKSSFDDAPSAKPFSLALGDDSDSESSSSSRQLLQATWNVDKFIEDMSFNSPLSGGIDGFNSDVDGLIGDMTCLKTPSNERAPFEKCSIPASVWTWGDANIINVQNDAPSLLPGSSDIRKIWASGV